MTPFDQFSKEVKGEKEDIYYLKSYKETDSDLGIYRT